MATDDSKALREQAKAAREQAAELESRAAELRKEARRLAGLEALAAMAEAAMVPVDRTKVQLTDGSPVPEDGSHREAGAHGMQKAYVVLSADERSKGFVRPYRDAHRHLKCGAVTIMGWSIAETYARDPSFYSGTYCARCQAHFPVGEDGEFVWYEMDGRDGPKVGT